MKMDVMHKYFLEQSGKMLILSRIRGTVSISSIILQYH